MVAKTNLHPRNRHNEGYDFERLVADLPELKPFTSLNPRGQTTINFQDANAVRTLNRALLKTHYQINFWDIPENYLCPPIPGRADYIHYLADLLSENNNRQIPMGHHIKALDFGTGASMVYPLLGHSEYNWQFTGVDIDPIAIKSAKQICKANKLKVRLKLQENAQNVFKGVIIADDFYHITMCNPPFHSSLEQANKGTERKWRNLGKGKSKRLNFGGQNAELWAPGGEIKFIANMIKESAEFADQCMWFTTLVSKKDNLKPLDKILNDVKAVNVRTIEMSQGQKTSRFIAWSYMSDDQRASYF